MRVPLKTPHRSIERRAALLFAAAGAIFFLSSLRERGALPLQVMGAAVTGLAMFVLMSAVRVRAWKDFHVELDDDALELPVEPLAKRTTLRIPYEEIEMVSYRGVGQRPRIEILARSGAYAIPFDWFPKSEKPTELGLRIHIRSQLARANEDVEAVELAALEATMLAGKSFGAFVVERLGQTPEVVATIDDPSEKQALSEDLKGRGARMVDCSHRIRALRDALERGLAAPSFSAQREKVE